MVWKQPVFTLSLHPIGLDSSKIFLTFTCPQLKIIAYLNILMLALDKRKTSDV
jgi:hypothetical protein